MSRKAAAQAHLARLANGTDMLGADGAMRTIEAERDLNDTFAALFGNDGGQKALDYLRSVTILRVQGPHVTDGELRHLEGQRFLVALIESRINFGRQHKPELPSEARKS